MMTEKQCIKLSKFLSLVLRHQPDLIGVELDAQGWAQVSLLRRKASAVGNPFSIEDLEFVVTHNDKQRFAFSDDKQKIRASQGHSLKVDLGYEPIDPPEILYHGTASRFVQSIFNNGIGKGNRTHVHLSANKNTAIQVGNRHGKPVVLTIAAGEMNRAGHVFYLSANGVWLTDRVPPQYIHAQFSDQSDGVFGD